MVHALIFDSGVGGLSVSAEIRKVSPGIQQSYVADDMFRPYGEKTDQQLRERLPGLLWTLCETLKPDLVVMACNTASTSALSEIRAELDIPVIGVVPAIKPAAALSRTRSFAVLGTPGTVRRQYVDQLIKDFAPDHSVILQGSTRLVALAEDKLAGRPVHMGALSEEIAPIFKDPDVDCVVLACTHFPLLIEELAAAAPPGINWVDSGEAIARRVQSVAREISVFRPRRTGPDLALLVGQNNDPVRARAFKDYGFERVVGLLDSSKTAINA